MKGIILAGGSGTRLHPITKSVSKQLLPVYDKPMIYYPLSILMLAGIRDIMIISTPGDLPAFRKLFGTGDDIGLRLAYAEQPRPEGLPQAFIIAEQFLDGSPSCLILGDNIFYGQNLTSLLRSHLSLASGGVLFAHQVTTPSRYGVVEIDANRNVLSLEEKPEKPKSRLAVTGLYLFGPDVAKEATKLQPGRRGELEILDLAERYRQRGELKVELLGRGTAWFDTGTHESLLDAANFIHAVQSRQGLQIACLEEIALRQSWIDSAALQRITEGMGRSSYGEYLRGLPISDNMPPIR